VKRASAKNRPHAGFQGAAEHSSRRFSAPLSPLHPPFRGVPHAGLILCFAVTSFRSFKDKLL